MIKSLSLTTVSYHYIQLNDKDMGMMDERIKHVAKLEPPPSAAVAVPQQAAVTAKGRVGAAKQEVKQPANETVKGSRREDTSPTTHENRQSSNVSSQPTMHQLPASIIPKDIEDILEKIKHFENVETDVDLPSYTPPDWLREE